MNLLGVIVVLLLESKIKLNFKNILVWLSIFGVTIVAILFISPLKTRILSLTSSTAVKSAFLQYETIALKGDSVPHVSKKYYNLLQRVYYWYIAGKDIEASPILGIGFGRYNDLGNFYIKPKRGLFNFALGYKKVFSKFTAHNSFLYIWAETGFVGLIWILYIWYSIFKILSNKYKYCKDLKVKGLYKAAQGVIILILVSSLFAFTLGAPAMCIPAFILIGMMLVLSPEEV